MRVFDAEGEEIAALELLQVGSALYIPEKDISSLFSGRRTHFEALRGRITIAMMGKRIVFTLGQNQLKVDDEEYTIPNPPASVSGRVALPLEFLTEILPVVIGKQVRLDRENWVLQISQEPYSGNAETGLDSQISPHLAEAEFRVVIDPGHGGYDAGARSKTGLLVEKELTLEIAQRMKGMLLAEKGVAADLTRSKDDYISAVDRVGSANELRGQLYVSVHFNWSPSQVSRGFRIYVNSKHMRLGTGFEFEADTLPKSKPVQGQMTEAERLLPQGKWLAREMAKRLRDIGLTGYQGKEASLAAMDDLSMPCVLVELLYLSNQQDLTILSRPGFIDSASRALCDSILAFRAFLRDQGKLKP